MDVIPFRLAVDELVVSGALIREIDDAMVLPCDFEDCLGRHQWRATWLIEVKHGKSCTVATMAICSMCRDGLHRARHEQVACASHGALGYSVGAWWRPLRVLP